MSLSLGVILLAPPISQTRRSLSQPNWIAALVVLENVCLVSGGAFTIWSAAFGENLMEQPLFWLGLTFMAVDGGISSLLTQIISKDYVRQLYGDDEKKTAFANGCLLCSDLGVNVVTFYVLGQLSESGVLGAGPSSLYIMATWHIIAGGIVLAVLSGLHRFDTTLKATGADAAQEQEQQSIFLALANGAGVAMRLEWVAKRAMMAYFCLSFTVVTTGSTMSTYLRIQGVSDGAIGTFRSAGEFAGFVGTVVTPLVVWCIGVVSAGVWIQRLQTVAVQVCFLCMIIPSLDATALMSAVVVSRFGLWGFDLAERSLIQLRVHKADPKNAILVFNFERAVGELIFFFMNMITFFLHKPEDFTILVGLSAAAVTTASILLAIPGSSSPSVSASDEGVALASS